jgi:hypothetical protein
MCRILLAERGKFDAPRYCRSDFPRHKLYSVHRPERDGPVKVAKTLGMALAWARCPTMIGSEKI